MGYDKKATIIETGKPILVYKSKLRKDNWINSFDLNTEYKTKELKF